MTVGVPEQPDDIGDLVSRTRTPALLVQLPSSVIIAASPGAHDLFGPIAPPLVGRAMLDVVEPHHPGGMQLLVTGRITGYEAILQLRGTGRRRRFWFTALSGTGTVLAVSVGDGDDDDGADTGGGIGALGLVASEHEEALRPVLGTADARLLIEQISVDVADSLGHQPEAMVGSSLLEWFAPDDVPMLLAALAETAVSGAAVTRRAGVVADDGQVVHCQLVLLPLVPPPSCAFALLAERAGDGPADSRTVARLITRLGRGLRGGITSPSVATAPIRSDVDLAHLTHRELEVISHLIAGDRVPAIAKRLFLSEGTIRNNLSSAFAKVGVKNQQQLIELLRSAPSGHTRPT